MVKTKLIAKKAPSKKPVNLPKLKEGLNNGWWESMQDGETCRTTDEKKVHIAIQRSIEEEKGIIIQGFNEHSVYAWYMTRVLTHKEVEKPSKKVARKGKKK